MAEDQEDDIHIVNMVTDDNMIEIVVQLKSDPHNPMFPLGHDYITSPPASAIIIRKATKTPPTTDSRAPKPFSIVKQGDKLLWKCKLCGYYSKSDAIMKKHQKVHETMKPNTKFVKCNKCDDNQDVDEYVYCPKCSFFAKNMKNLKIHMNVHNRAEPYTCVECPFKGATLKDLSVHYQDHQDKLVLLFVCDMCSFTSRNKTAYDNHYLIHTGGITFKCKACNFTALTEDLLTKHVDDCYLSLGLESFLY